MGHVHERESGTSSESLQELTIVLILLRSCLTCHASFSHLGLCRVCRVGTCCLLGAIGSSAGAADGDMHMSGESQLELLYTPLKTLITTLSCTPWKSMSLSKPRFLRLRPRIRMPIQAYQRL